MSAIDTVVVPIHRAGWPFIAGFAVVSLVLGLAVWAPLGWIGLALTLWCAYFFRDPDRVTPTRPGLLVSPADGRVTMIVQAVPLQYSICFAVELYLIAPGFDAEQDAPELPARISPATSSFAPGDAVPIPTSPEDLMETPLVELMLEPYTNFMVSEPLSQPTVPL